MDAVGLQHRFGEFCDDVNRRFGWEIQQGPPVNTSEPVAVDPAFVRRIERDNALDMALFDHACRVVDRRRGARSRLRRLVARR
jgi:hypothetical protein